MKMWGGRFEGEMDDAFIGFSRSLGFDARLFPHDIEVSKAWAGVLGEAGVLDGGEERDITGALTEIGKELESGSFDFLPEDEDIHTAVERRLVEIVGPAGGKIRTGRSRNDQVACDLRLLVMDECLELDRGLRSLIASLIGQAERNMGVCVPGHTHLQHAQPVLLSHALLAFAQMFRRDVERVAGARRSADLMPLGSGALAGTTVPVDTNALAGRLGFSRVSENSMDAVGDRDFVCDALYAVSMIMVHLSRLAEQVVLMCSSEFALARLDDAWATGSSLMPQKKNPDGAELIRGKCGRALGGLVAVMTALKGLPLSYNRDLQEDKEPLFDAFDTALASLEVMSGTVKTIEFDRERAAELVRGGMMTATDLADYLAAKGMEFPEAHRVVGGVVMYCLEEGRELWELSVEELARFSELLDEDALELVSIEASVERRDSPGGTSPAQVARQLKDLKTWLSG